MSDFEDRLAALDPAAGQPYQHRDLDALITTIVAQPARPRAAWWHRFELMVASTAIAGSLVAAGAVAIFQSAPAALPVLALQHSVAAARPGPGGTGTKSAVATQEPMQIYEEFNFTPGPGLAQSAAASPSYQLTTASDGAKEAARVAAVFGVTGTPRDTNGDGSDWLVSDPSGAALDYENTGVPQWYYSSTTPSIAPATESSTASGPVPSESTVASDAQRYLRALGYDYTVSSPNFGSSTTSSLGANGTSQVISSTEDVSYTVDVGGTPTGESVNFSVDASNQVVYASGPAFHVNAPLEYPLQSPVAAVSALNAAERAKYADNTNPPPVVQATLNTATLSLAEYQLVNGQIWMLPVYVYAGDVTRAGASPSSGTWSELALSPAYVQFGASSTPLHRGVFNF